MQVTLISKRACLYALIFHIHLFFKTHLSPVNDEYALIYQITKTASLTCTYFWQALIIEVRLFQDVYSTSVATNLQFLLMHRKRQSNFLLLTCQPYAVDIAVWSLYIDQFSCESTVIQTDLHTSAQTEPFLYHCELMSLMWKGNKIGQETHPMLRSAVGITHILGKDL